MEMKCINCVWEGDESLTKKPLNHCPVCGDNTKPIIPQTNNIDMTTKPKLPQPNLDLNNDGKVDAQDSKLASKVMNVIK